MSKRNKNILEWSFVSLVILVFAYFRLTDYYTPIDEEPEIQDFNGTWIVAKSDFHRENTTLKFKNGQVTLSNFPDLTTFRGNGWKDGAQVQLRSGEYGAVVQMMPRGWGVALAGNNLRYVSKRGIIYLQQFGSVQSNREILYKRKK